MAGGQHLASDHQATAATCVEKREIGQIEVPALGSMIDVPETSLIPGDVRVRPEIPYPVEDDSEAATRGMKWFTNFNCAGCHAANGGGGMGPALSNHVFVYGSEPENIYLTISHGRPKGMPAWGTILPDRVIWDLVAYIRSISDAPNPQRGQTISVETFTIEQVPAEVQSTPNPWQYTQPFSYGQKPLGDYPEWVGEYGAD